jgi:hypothetical protein
MSGQDGSTLGVRYSFSNRDLAGTHGSDPSFEGDLLVGSRIAYRAREGVIGFAFSI